MARPRKPTNLKVVAGTDRKDREPDTHVELPLVSEIPDAPDWLTSPHAIKEWNRLAAILHANGLLTEAGLAPLAHMCGLHGKIVQLYAAGESPTGHMVAQYRNFANDFGLTPVAQGKVKGPEQTKPGNKFAGNGKRA